MKRVALALAFLGALPLAAAADVTKEEIKKLAAAGISDDVILAYIRANAPVQKLTPDDLIELKQAGVSEKVLGALASGAPAAPPPARTEVIEKKVYVPQTTYVYETPTYYYPAYTYYPTYSYYSYSTCYPYYSHYPRYYYPSYGFYYSSGYRHCYPRSGLSVYWRW